MYRVGPGDIEGGLLVEEDPTQVRKRDTSFRSETTYVGWDSHLGAYPDIRLQRLLSPRSEYN